MKNKFDEDAVRVRPGRSTRPRSKERPAHATAQRALVTTIDRGRYTCALGSDPSIIITAITARELGKSAVVVGDQVDLVGDLSGNAGSLARIVRVIERSTALRRSADDQDSTERILVANADQLAIVVAATQPDPQPRLLDRCLIAGWHEQMRIILIITKTDLATPKDLINSYQELVSQIITVQKNGSIDEVHKALSNRKTVLVGSSGVGKSTLVNSLLPSADRRTGEVNLVTGRGRHTSTAAAAIWLADETWIIDTPGIRTFGIAHVPIETIERSFTDLEPYLSHCLKSCVHNQPDCGLNSISKNDSTLVERADSLRRLVATRY